MRLRGARKDQLGLAEIVRECPHERRQYRVRGVQAKRDLVPRPLLRRQDAFQRGRNADSRTKTAPPWHRPSRPSGLLAGSDGDNVRLDRAFGRVRRIPRDNAPPVERILGLIVCCRGAIAAADQDDRAFFSHRDPSAGQRAFVTDRNFFDGFLFKASYRCCDGDRGTT